MNLRINGEESAVLVYLRLRTPNPASPLDVVLRPLSRSPHQKEIKTVWSIT